MESTFGPLRGLYVSVQAVPTGPGSSDVVSSYRLFTVRPNRYSDEGHIACEMSPQIYPDQLAALQAAALQGGLRVLQLRPKSRSCTGYQSEYLQNGDQPSTYFLGLQ